jgi:N-acetylglucosamine-6-phosphate deacetylase
MIFQNAELILPDRILRGSLRLEANKITAVAAELPPHPGEETIDLGGQFLAPGFIDLHIHGALGRDTMEATSEAFAAICNFHASGGTTSLALTTITAVQADIFRVLDAVHSYQSQPVGGAAVLGVHIEGPYFSPLKPGAHELALIRPPQREEWSQWLAHPTRITQITLAPELPGALELIDALTDVGVRPSAGHSDAWDEDCAAAYAHGLRQVTHTYNCMSTARRRGPYRVAGLLEFAMSKRDILCELIADGHHVSPTLMRALFEAKGPSGIALITDACGGAGLPEGTPFQLLNIDCHLRDGVGMTDKDGVLAGSASTMIQCVKNMVQLVGVSLPEAVGMATHNPARALGLEKSKGALIPGADADLVCFDKDFQVTRTLVAGQEVFLGRSEPLPS